MKKWIAVIVILLVAAGAFAYGVTRSAQTPPVAIPEPTPESDDRGDAPHPLSRDAIAARQYPGGEIKVERDLGEQGGFHSYVVSYPSDGYKIFSLMNVPSGRAPAGGWPVVIFNHGYIPPKEYRTTGGDYQYWINGLSRSGFLVLKPDYRGHDQSEGPTGGNWSPDYSYDILNLVSSLKRYPHANAGRIGMAGHSMGANVTLRVVTASADVKSSVMLAGIVGNSEDLLYNWRRTPRPGQTPGMFGNQRQRLLEQHGDPKQNSSFWNAVSPINYVNLITGPVQIHHGTSDEVVPLAFSERLNGAMANAGKPAEFYAYPGADHQFTGQGDLVLNRMLALFNRTLK